MKKSHKLRYVRVRTLNTITKEGYPVVLDYTNGTSERFKQRTGIYLKEIPKNFEGIFKRQHSPDYKILQETLDRKVAEMNTAIGQFEETYGRRPTKKELKLWLKKPYVNSSKRLTTLLECCSMVYSLKLEKLSKESAENYKSLAFAIQDFSTRMNTQYTVDDINEAFLTEFINYLLFFKPLKESTPRNVTPKHKLIPNSRNSYFDKNYGMCNKTLIKRMYTFITILKVFSTETDTLINIDKIRLMIESVKSKLKISDYTYLKPTLSFQEFKLLCSPKFSDFLKDDFIEFSSNQKTIKKTVSREVMNRAKDLLIVSIAGGGRFSDVTTMTERNLTEGLKKSIKTGIDYNVVNNELTKAIYEKYHYDFQFSNQRYNKILIPLLNQFQSFLHSELGSYQDQPFWKIENRGEYIKELKLDKWSAIRSHSARRSFATIARLEFKVEKEEIRKITGHSSDRMLDEYIQVSQGAGYKQINQIMNITHE